MKWRELYTHLLIDNPDAALPDNQQNSDFMRMSDRRAFYLTLCHTENNERGSIEPTCKMDTPLQVTISQAVMSEEDLELTCKTVGTLPPGIRHGTYVLKFKDPAEMMCSELPVAMFEDAEVPEEELSNWGPR